MEAENRFRHPNQDEPGRDGCNCNAGRMNLLNSALECVASAWGVTTEELKSKSRAHPLPEARAAYFRISRTYTRYPLSRIGAEIKRNHSTVSQSLYKEANERSLDKWYASAFREANKAMAEIISGPVVAETARIMREISSLPEGSVSEIHRHCAAILGKKLDESG